MKQKFNPSVKRLKETLSIQTYSHDYKQACEFIIKRLSNMPGVVYSKDEHDNFYATKGKPKPDEFYPCVVAHHDTVHDVVEDKTIHRSNGYFYAFNHVTGKQVGTGGDDLVGVWSALEILEHQPICKVALFSQEEIGCVGSGKADMKFFDDVGYVFQTDRKGNDDFVTSIGGTKLSSTEFQSHIKPVLTKHGYKCTQGGLTDVKTLTTNGIGVCTANMSSGYYRPHTASEIVIIPDARNVCKMMNNLINHLGLTRWEMKYKAPTYDTYSTGWGNYGGYGYRTYPTNYGTITRKANYGNSWTRNPKSKTEMKGKKIQGFLNKGFNNLNVNELKSFVDTMKFYCKAANVPPIQAIEDLMPWSFDIYQELNLVCGDCLTDSLAEPDYDVEWFEPNTIDNVKDLACVNSGCDTSVDFYEHVKKRIAQVKKAERQYLLDFKVGKND